MNWGHFKFQNCVFHYHFIYLWNIRIYFWGDEIYSLLIQQNTYGIARHYVLVIFMFPAFIMYTEVQSSPYTHQALLTWHYLHWPLQLSWTSYIKIILIVCYPHRVEHIPYIFWKSINICSLYGIDNTLCVTYVTP